MKKIYIAGKINGLSNYREIFKEAEDKLTAEGNVVMNPAVLSEGFDYDVYLPICLLMLQACDTVFMLNNWQTSKGAKVELEFAKAQGKEIVYQKDDFITYVCDTSCTELDTDNIQHCTCAIKNDEDKFYMLNKECPCGNVPNWELKESK